MTVALIDQTAAVFDDEQTAVIRDCLRQIGDADRALLWTWLDGLRSAMVTNDLTALVRIPSRAPDGPIRRCLFRLVRPIVRAHERNLPMAGMTSVEVRGHARPAFLGLYRGLQGTVTPVDAWATRGLLWEKVEPDAFADVNTSTWSHEPIPLDYRHDPKVVLGCSRQWTVADDGALHGRFDIGSHPVAQHAARAAERGELGLSMLVRLHTRWLAHPSPDEWSPADGVLDVCVHDHANIEAVSLTPSPTFPQATVARVW
jgi:phage head maturation protease